MKTEPSEAIKRTKRIFAESLDGESYGGNTYNEVVADMRSTAWGGADSDGVRGYMKQVSKRIWDWSRKQIRIDSAEHFLRDMEKEGLVKVTILGEDK